MALLPADNPVRQLVERALAGRRSQGPVSIALGAMPSPVEPAERLLMCHAIEDTAGRFLGVMLVARNLGFLSHVHSTLNYSRKLAALGRLMAGVAHEVKNPLNAMTIHLELLQAEARGGAASRSPCRPPSGGTARDRRLTQARQGHRRRDPPARSGGRRFSEVRASGGTAAAAGAAGDDHQRGRLDVGAGGGAARRHACDWSARRRLPDINADPGMLQQAVLNLALNACQAMPNGGTLKLSCRSASHRRVEIDVEDTGVGIPPENLGKIFDLYFTTKETGTGIGLSMVFRIVQLHDGEVEVESTPGRGTRFRLVFPQA